ERAAELEAEQRRERARLHTLAAQVGPTSSHVAETEADGARLFEELEREYTRLHKEARFAAGFPFVVWAVAWALALAFHESWGGRVSSVGGWLLPAFALLFIRGLAVVACFVLYQVCDVVLRRLGGAAEE